MLPPLDVLRPAFDWRVITALQVGELERIRCLPGLTGPVQVAVGHGCVIFTGHRFDLVAACLVDADEPWPGDPGVSSAPRWVPRADGRRCALSCCRRRKAGTHRVVLGRLSTDAGTGGWDS